ncbi:hypothetical protein C0989_009069 [Termitomyces sp. Mn162]|nr:hypothetical protein C0989_009069 [Termitomyces sp. Mn162]KAH0585400.1 hypothetical protein H2248_008640 [Termitomyces sp. 'cryptogamus']
MAPVNFKLTELNGLTRRVTFPDKPSWNSLAAKIELLYGIPLEKVSVSYIDVDNDQVTLSSQEELDDFFATLHTNGQAIKFTVQDLPTVRLQRTLSHSSRNPSRNTFGIGAFDIEDDWQTLPMPPISELQGLFMPNVSTGSQPHAFLETLDSDAGTLKNEGTAHHENVASSPTSSSNSPVVVSLDKGKQKAIPNNDVSTTGSVLGEDAPPKPPVHVYVFQTPTKPDVAFGSPSPPAESTPKVDTQILDIASKDDPTDPPLPSIDQDTHASTSFFNDLSSFLTTFSHVIAGHPELSEGIRNILRNTFDGTYWHTHRDALSQTAQNIARDTEMVTEALRRQTEEATRRRVADVLEGIFRTLSETLRSADANVSPTFNPTTNAQFKDEAKADESVRANEAPGASCTPNPPRPFVSEPDSRMLQGPGGWRHRGTPLPRPSPFIPPRNSFGSRYSPHLPVPPPPPTGSWRRLVPPPPPPPPIPGIHDLGSSLRDHLPRPSGPLFTPTGPPPPSMEASMPQASKPTPQELRAQVDEAKANYRTWKDKYRLDREERRKERGTKTQGATPELNKPTAPFPFARPTTPVIAVQGTNSRPTHEEVVTIRRHNTHLGHGHSRRHGHGPENNDLRTRTVNRIAKRLADMGFSESTHPDLPSKIQAQLPFDGVVRNDSEDDIVTTLLEDLLALSPTSPVASGSGAREIPGAWYH